MFIAYEIYRLGFGVDSSLVDLNKEGILVASFEFGFD
jgi:hypothetical protein